MGASRRRELWPLAVAALLASMIGVCLVFWTIAATHMDAEVVDDAYLAGLRLGAEHEARERAEARGLALELEARPETDGVAVVVRVRGTSGPTATAERVVVRRERPAEGGFDADFELTRSDAGYRGHVPLPRPGRWRLVARASVGDASLERRLAWWAD